MTAPDFEQIASVIIDTYYSLDDMEDPAITIQAAIADVAAQLREVWNARGAADIAVIVVTADVWDDIVAPIKALDC